MFKARLIGDAIIFCAAAVAWGLWTAAIVGCSNSNATKILGTWESTSPEILHLTVGFDKLGNYSREQHFPLDETPSIPITGTWSFSGDVLTASMLGQDEKYTVAFNGNDRMSWTQAASVWEFRRVLDQPAK